MKTVCCLLVVALIAACGVETVGTAVTAAVGKQQELEQGRADLGKVQQQVQEASQQSAQRAAQLDAAK